MTKPVVMLANELKSFGDLEFCPRCGGLIQPFCGIRVCSLMLRTAFHRLWNSLHPAPVRHEQ